MLLHPETGEVTVESLLSTYSHHGDNHLGQITRLIDSAIQNAAPHLRSARSATADKARRVATAPQCAAIEHDLDSLLRSALPTAELLEAIAALESKHAGPGRSRDSSRTLKIHALLLMRRR